MSTSGTISGTPTVSGTFNYTVTVKDSAGNTGTVNCSVTVGPPVSATCVTINAIQGVPITPVTMVGSGGAGGPYTFTATGLPAGLTMSTSGTISGTPTVSGTFNYTVTVTDKAGNTGTVNCSVTVAPPVSATCVVINAVQGVPITPVTMVGSGGAGGPYTFTATGLPAGLTMSSSGTISGTPTVSGTFNYTVTVKDSAGHTGTVNCSVTVTPPAVSATCVVINAVQGTPITPVTEVGSGGVGGPYTFTVTGLPAGLTMSTSGTISGTPTVSGSFNITVTVKDSAGNTGTVNCSVTVNPPVVPTCGANLLPLTYNITEQSSNAGEVVWFNSHLTKVSGTIPTSTFQVFIQNGQITFGTQTLLVPNAVITFDSTASCASTSFDAANNTWNTTIPLSKATQPDEIFAAGLAYLLPPGFAQNVKNVTWSATVFSTAPGLQLSWQYGASNWLTSSGANTFPQLAGSTISNFLPDYNGMMINPAHNLASCAGYPSGDHSGAPEFSSRQSLMVGGGSGGGGSNWTGSWSSTPSSVSFVCANTAVTRGDTATIGFWHNKNGQALILAVNGGGSSTALGTWLAINYPYLFGPSSPNNMAGQTNATVAALFMTFFNVTGQKTYAQIMAGALADYVTNSTLSGTVGAQYGFKSSPEGTGTQTYNVGSYGTLIGLQNNTSYTVQQLLQQANLDLQNGTFNADAFNSIFDGINQFGDIN
jgi:hypothetical protein